jgi:hypothetical protein
MISSTHFVTRKETREARLVDGGARGLTVAHLRQFLAEVDKLELPDTTQVRYDSKLAHEGGTSTITLTASWTEEIDVEARP